MLNQTQFGLSLHFSLCFDTKLNSIWCQISQESVITIQISFDLARLRKKSSVSTCKILSRKDAAFQAVIFDTRQVFTDYNVNFGFGFNRKDLKLFDSILHEAMFGL